MSHKSNELREEGYPPRPFLAGLLIVLAILLVTLGLFLFQLGFAHTSTLIPGTVQLMTYQPGSDRGVVVVSLSDGRVIEAYVKPAVYVTLKIGSRVTVKELVGSINGAHLSYTIP